MKQCEKSWKCASKSTDSINKETLWAVTKNLKLHCPPDRRSHFTDYSRITKQDSGPSRTKSSRDRYHCVPIPGKTIGINLFYWSAYWSIDRLNTGMMMISMHLYEHQNKHSLPHMSNFLSLEHSKWNHGIMLILIVEISAVFLRMNSVSPWWFCFIVTQFHREIIKAKKCAHFNCLFKLSCYC